MVQSVETEALTETRPLGQIQADMFCAGCGYNLYSQAVMRDPHMEILVCRCPECGKYSPAGVASDAANRWRYGLGVWFLILRVLVLAGLMVTALILMGVLPYALADEMVRRWEYYGYNAYMQTKWDQLVLQDRALFSVLAVALGLATGLVMVLGLYHWPRRFYRWSLLAPAVVLVVACVIWRLDYSERPHRLFAPIATRQTTVDQYMRAFPQSAPQHHTMGPPPGMPVEPTQFIEQQRQALMARLNEARPLPSPAAHMAAMAALISLGMFVTKLIGRPVTRGILRMLLPARALQPLAVLWFVDGKKPPKPTST